MKCLGEKKKEKKQKFLLKNKVASDVSQNLMRGGLEIR